MFTHWRWAAGNLKKVFLIAFIGLLLNGNATAQFYNGTQTTFGKNRVQYNDFFWMFYRFKNYDAYFYAGGQELTAYLGHTADKEIEEIEKLFDYRSDGRLQFVVFNKLSDLKQTNIGLDDDEQMNNIGGLTRIVGNRVLIYFNGNHEHFRQQVRAGTAQVLIDQLMYGGSIKDRLQSAVLLQLPTWYVQGLVSYVSSGWNTQNDNRMRDGIVSGRFKKFNKLVGTEEIFAGHSMWHYIMQTYGPSTVSNMLYMSRMNRNVESGFQYVLGQNLKTLSRNWLTYYQKLYLDADKNREFPQGDPLIKKPKQNIITQVKISPDGQQAAYVANDIGKYRVWIHDLKTGKRKCIAKGGYKSVNQKQDVSFPLLAWHPTGRHLTMIRETKGKLWMDFYTVASRKTERTKFFYFEKVLDFAYADDGQTIVLSGVQRGQSDIYVFNVRGRSYQPLTKDIYDDLHPRFVSGSRFIIFSSNRSSDTLEQAASRYFDTGAAPSFDIFLYDYLSRSQVLKRITNSPGVDDLYPMSLDTLNFTYLSDENGIYNRYVAHLDSVISFIDTVEHYRYIVETHQQSNYARNIMEHDVNFRQTRYGEIVFNNGRYNIYIHPAPEASMRASVQDDTPFRRTLRAEKRHADALKAASQKQVIKIKDSKLPEDSSKIDIENYIFQTEFPKKKKKDTQEKKQDELPQDTRGLVEPVAAVSTDSLRYLLPKQRNYEIAFSANYFISQLDNSLLNATYQSFTGGAFYFDPGLNGLFKVGMSDLFNDYKITGGFRLSGDLNSNEYFLSFDNLKKRIDRTVSFYRQAREDVIGGFAFLKVHTHELKYTLKFPFNDISSLRGSAAFRYDRFVIRATDLTTLQVPNFYEYWGSAKLEYVYDNTINKGLNLMNGLRLKIFGEAFRIVDEPKTWLTVFGADFRHYQKLHRQIILASRFAASTSQGDLKLIYYLGSVDNTIVPVDNFNYDIPIDYSQNYAFQAVATNMRGFTQNIRNGNSFAVINEEIRIPVFQYLINRPIRSDFIRNFQVVGFADVGAAWTGPHPYSDENTFNTDIIVQNPLTIVINKQVEPLVAGYGIGLRSRVIGYFVRTDWAWGYEDKTLGKSIFYFSLGLDF